MLRGLIQGLLLLGLCSCKPAPVSLFSAPEPLEARDYKTVLAKWTRADKVYKALDNKIFLRGTFHTPEFRRAFAARFPDIYGVGGDITRRELVELGGEVEEHYNFLLSVHTPDRDWNDFEQKDSIWRISLVNDQGVDVDATEIRPIKIDANLRQVYPYVTRFDRLYLVRFPLADALDRVLLTPDTAGMQLRAASALGVAELSWEFERLQ